MQVYIFLYKLHCIARACSSSSSNSSNKQAHAPRPHILVVPFLEDMRGIQVLGIVMSDNYIIVQLTPTQTQVGRCSNTRQEMRMFISPKISLTNIYYNWEYILIKKKAFVPKRRLFLLSKKSIISRIAHNWAFIQPRPPNVCSISMIFFTRCESF